MTKFLEKAINNLNQLEEAMAKRGYSLFVERHSSFYRLLENGTGIYKRLWTLMTKRQATYLMESIEEGVILAKHRKNVAVVGGRETLYFDTQRFGGSNFHLSEKLNTAYSAMALQLGCPYIEEVNKILMSIYEAGIISKMTENEYEKLGKQKEIRTKTVTSSITTEAATSERITKATEENEKLQPISLKMLQGTFYLLSLGYMCAGVILGAEIIIERQEKQIVKGRAKRYRQIFVPIKNSILMGGKRVVEYTQRFYRRHMNEAIISTLEYLE